MTTTSSKFRFLRTSSTTSSALRGLAFGAGAGVLVCVAAWLSPLAAADRPALALLGVTLSLPLGCVVARRPADTNDARGVGITAVVAALVFSAVLTLPAPGLWLHTAWWCTAAVLLGASIGSTVRGAGVAATCFWLFLNGLPFFYDKLPVLRDTAESWALQGCPWLGFSSDAFGGDPLRRPVLYLGQWTGLSGSTSFSLLRISTLWLAAVPAFAALIVACIPARGATPAPRVEPEP
jgi:hypothetical protein